MRHPVHAIAAAVITSACLAAATAYSPRAMTQEIHAMPQTSPASIKVPSTHVQSRLRDVLVDGEAAILTRHVRSDGRNQALGGEHFSTVVSAAGVLKGFTHMSMDLAGRHLPSRERSEAIARSFLQQHAPDLLPRMRISWIEPHDEPLTVQRGESAETIQLTGMKVKARNLADNRWFWVIVGADEQVMVFERDIVWVSFPGHRKTEKWLHDNWLETQGQPASKPRA